MLSNTNLGIPCQKKHPHQDHPGYKTEALEDLNQPLATEASLQCHLEAEIEK